MTKEQAKTKWCEKRAIVRQLKLLNSILCVHLLKTETDKAETLAIVREADKVKNDNCIASDCMMWREGKRDINPPHGVYEYIEYCGLAGKPERR